MPLYVRGSCESAPIIESSQILLPHFLLSHQCWKKYVKMELMDERLLVGCRHCWMSRCVRLARPGAAAGMGICPALW